MTIQSHQNHKLKEIRKLRQRRRWRERAGQFVAEGEDLLQAADAAGWAPIERYCAAGSGLGGVEVEPRLLAQASALGSGTRALGVYQERWLSAPAGPLCVYLHGVHDPGNVGAILRSAEAFGASSVALGPGSADPFGPKAVRASMGAVFTVPLARAHGLADLPGTKIALMSTGDGTSLSELCGSDSGGWNQIGEDRRGAAATADPRALTLLVGSERDGLPEQLVDWADHVAHIPIRTHSLNAAMAATIALYEVTRMAPR
jgi:TrmH family RNA methyltransferase